MGDGIAPDVEPPATAGEVHPSLSKPALGVGADVKVFRPFAVGQRVRIRVGNPGLSPVMELSFVAQATVGTGNIKHTISLVGNWF